MTAQEKRTYSVILREAGITSGDDCERVLDFLDRLSDIMIRDFMQKQARYGSKENSR